MVSSMAVTIAIRLPSAVTANSRMYRFSAISTSGAVAGELLRLTRAVGVHDPQVGAAVVGRLVPRRETVRDLLAVGREGDLGDRVDARVVGGNDVVRAIRRGGGHAGDGDQQNECG